MVGIPYSPLFMRIDLLLLVVFFKGGYDPKRDERRFSRASEQRLDIRSSARHPARNRIPERIFAGTRN
jgi:hypothetical protein